MLKEFQTIRLHTEFRLIALALQSRLFAPIYSLFRDFNLYECVIMNT